MKAITITRKLLRVFLKPEDRKIGFILARKENNGMKD
jgi:hypothetical protein